MQSVVTIQRLNRRMNRPLRGRGSEQPVASGAFGNEFDSWRAVGYQMNDSILRNNNEKLGNKFTKILSCQLRGLHWTYPKQAGWRLPNKMHSTWMIQADQIHLKIALYRNGTGSTSLSLSLYNKLYKFIQHALLVASETIDSIYIDPAGGSSITLNNYQ